MIMTWALVLVLSIVGGHTAATQIPMESSVMCDNARDSAAKQRYVVNAFCVRTARDQPLFSPKGVE